MNRVERQADRYRRAMGQAALERQLVETRCAECLGTLPYGHRHTCSLYGGVVRKK